MQGPEFEYSEDSTINTRHPVVNFLKAITPPALTNLARRHLAGAFTLRGPYHDWDAAKSASAGYDAQAILESVKQAALQVKSGKAVFERDSVVYHHAQYVYPLLTCLFAAAAESGGRLSVLDFGGSLGSGYYLHRSLLNDLTQFDWHIVEQTAYAACGKQFFEDGQLTFHDSVSDVLEQFEPNVCVLQSTLQYLSDPMAVMTELVAGNFQYIYYDTTPFSPDSVKSIVIQDVRPHIYQGYRASYPSWILDHEELMQAVKPRYRLIAEFDTDQIVHGPAGIKANYQGGILKRTDET